MRTIAMPNVYDVTQLIASLNCYFAVSLHRSLESDHPFEVGAIAIAAVHRFQPRQELSQVPVEEDLSLWESLPNPVVSGEDEHCCVSAGVGSVSRQR
jgi:hypothetical protein